MRNSTERLFRSIDRHLAKPESVIGHFLRGKYPIIFSNTTDPFQRDEKVYRSTEAFMVWAKATGRSLFIQTKGNVLHDEWDRYSPLIVAGKDAVYVSIAQADDRVRRKQEPGALPIPARFEMIRALSGRGVPVIVAVNPYVREWIPSEVEFAERCAEAGARMLFLDTLHFTEKQAETLKRPYRDLADQANLLPMASAAIAKRWKAACDAFGLMFYASPNIIPPSEMSAAYCYAGDEQWFGGNPMFHFASALICTLENCARERGRPVLFGWPEIERFLREFGVANPTLEREGFWYAYNVSINADREAWNAALPKRIGLYDVLRYWWNHSYENSSMLWYDTRVHLVYSEADQCAAADSDCDLVGAFCLPGMGRNDGLFPYGPEIDRAGWLYNSRPRKR